MYNIYKFTCRAFSCFAFSFLIIGNLHAQQSPAKQYFAAGDKIYLLLESYISYMDFGKNSLTGEQPFVLVDSFTNLFIPGAMIYDEINPLNDICKPDTTARYLSPRDYISKVQHNYPSGIHSRIVKSNISFGELKSGKVSIILEKTIKCNYNEQCQVEVKDTIVLLCVIDSALEICKIKSISKVGSLLRITGGATCPCKPTHSSLEHPAGKSDKMGFGITIGVGGPLSNEFIKPLTSGSFKYEGLIEGLSYIKGAKMNSINTGVAGNLELDFWVDKKAGLGISTGLGYSSSYGVATADTIHLLYKAVNSSGTPFLRIYTASDIKEHLNYQNMDLPLILKFQKKISKRNSFYLDAGAAITFFNKVVASSQANVTQEAVYQYRNGQFVYSQQGPSLISKTDINMTYAYVLQHSNGNMAAVNSYFTENKQNFDIGLNQPATGSESFKLKMGYGGLLRTGVSLGLDKQRVAALNVGAGITLAEVEGNDKSGATLTDVLGKYNSIFNSVNNYLSLLYFINLGIQFKIK